MKNLIRKYRISFFLVVSVVLLLVVFFLVRLFYSVKAVQSGFAESNTNTEDVTWKNAETRNLQKEIYWYEQQLLLAKSDSISLGINLTEGLVQVQLKGTILFQSKILEQKPAHFYDSVNEELYLTFGKVLKISSENANIPKKPLKKIAAPKNESEVVEVKQDSIIPIPLNWNFKTDNNISVVINGVEMDADSTYVFHTQKDLFNHQIHEISGQLFPKEYSPTLFLWMNDKEARALYRAVPEKGKVVFRN